VAVSGRRDLNCQSAAAGALKKLRVNLTWYGIAISNCCWHVKDNEVSLKLSLMQLQLAA